MGADMVVALTVAVVSALVVFALQLVIAMRGIAAEVVKYRPMFPSPKPPAEERGSATA
jgi:hypothetical protein